MSYFQLLFLTFSTSLTKWSSVRLWTKWLWIRIPLVLLKIHIWCLLRAMSSLTFRQTIECGFTLKLVRDVIITYCQMHRTDKYSQHSSTNLAKWLQFNHLTTLVKWLSVRLRTKWLWVQILLQLHFYLNFLKTFIINAMMSFFWPYQKFKDQLLLILILYLKLEKFT